MRKLTLLILLFGFMVPVFASDDNPKFPRLE